MTTPATAFAPGSPAGGMPSFQSSSSAKSGDATQTGVIDHSGFTVNYGSGVLQGGAMSPWVLAGLALVGVFLWKKKST